MNMNMNMNDVGLCALLAWRIHGSVDAVRKTLFRLRDRVKRSLRPLVAQLIRHKQLGTWLQLLMSAECKKL